MSNGTSPEEDWWQTYKLSEEDWEQFERYPTPTDKFAFAKRVFSTNIINNQIIEINKLVDKKQYEKALSLLREYKDIASETSVNSEWIRMETDLVEAIKEQRIISIFYALNRGDFESAKKYINNDRTNNNSTRINVKTYSGKYEFGDATYDYTTALDGYSRIYNGKFEYEDSQLQVCGWFDDNKRDGEWIVLKRHDNISFILYANYNKGKHNGRYHYIIIIILM